MKNGILKVASNYIIANYKSNENNEKKVKILGKKFIEKTRVDVK